MAKDAFLDTMSPYTVTSMIYDLFPAAHQGLLQTVDNTLNAARNGNLPMVSYSPISTQNEKYPAS